MHLVDEVGVTLHARGIHAERLDASRRELREVVARS